eukprot:GHVO01035807.1.p1 GENE.GHVO01035807.1~~GHVO01035807.1.p1  ORF type:complete len:102 (+),score=10.93 GHVO01035807.1:40-306(+)
MDGVRSAEDMIQVRPMSDGDYRQATVPYDVRHLKPTIDMNTILSSTQQMAELNAEFDYDITNKQSNISWTKTQFDPDIIVGKEVSSKE